MFHINFLRVVFRCLQWKDESSWILLSLQQIHRLALGSSLWRSGGFYILLEIFVCIDCYTSLPLILSTEVSDEDDWFGHVLSLVNLYFHWEVFIFYSGDLKERSMSSCLVSKNTRYCRIVCNEARGNSVQEVYVSISMNSFLFFVYSHQVERTVFLSYSSNRSCILELFSISLTSRLKVCCYFSWSSTILFICVSTAWSMTFKNASSSASFP